MGDGALLAEPIRVKTKKFLALLLLVLGVSSIAWGEGGGGDAVDDSAFATHRAFSLSNDRQARDVAKWVNSGSMKLGEVDHRLEGTGYHLAMHDLRPAITDGVRTFKVVTFSVGPEKTRFSDINGIRGPSTAVGLGGSIAW